MLYYQTPNTNITQLLLRTQNVAKMFDKAWIKLQTKPHITQSRDLAQGALESVQHKILSIFRAHI